MLYSFQNRERAVPGGHKAWWVHWKPYPYDETNPANLRDYNTVFGVRFYRNTDLNGTTLINGPDHPSRPDNESRVYPTNGEALGSHLISINIEPMPSVRYSLPSTLPTIFKDYWVGLVAHLRSLTSDTLTIGGYWPWVDWEYEKRRTLGTIAPAEDAADEALWSQVSSTAPGSICGAMDVVMSPAYGNASINPRDALPGMIERMATIDRPWVPHLWHRHKDFDAPGDPYVDMPVGDFEYICETLAKQGIHDALYWLPGTGATTSTESEYIEIARNYFGRNREYETVVREVSPTHHWQCSETTRGDLHDTYGLRDFGVPAGISYGQNSLLKSHRATTCVSFSGSSGAFATSNQNIDLTGSFAGAAWFASSASGTDILFSQKNGSTNSGRSHILMVDGVIRSDLDSGGPLIGSASGLNDGQPHLVAWSFNATTKQMTLWVDGKIAADATLGGSTTGTDGAVVLGANKHGHGLWVGRVGPVSLWVGETIGQKTVARLYNAGNKTFRPGGGVINNSISSVVKKPLKT